MFLDHVITQVTTERESPVAHAAGMKFFTFMSAYMGVTYHRPAESLATDLTLMTAATVRRVLGHFMHPRR